MKQVENPETEIQRLRNAVKYKNSLLKKREWELKVEASLESVRASSLEMQESNELEKVVKTLAIQLTELGLSLDGALILFFDKEKRDISLWISTYQLPAPIKVNIPYDWDMQSNLIIQDFWEAFECGKGFINNSYSGKIKNDYFKFTVKNNLSGIPEPVRELQQEAKSWTFSAVAGKNALLGIDSWHEKFISNQDYLVLEKFSRVFEQAYTRFLDLQKAEAQAREAQIEAALEKVRSRAMAMHISTELKEVAHELRIQIGTLGQKDLDTCVIHLNDESPDYINAWAAMRPPGSTEEIQNFATQVPKKGLLIIEEALSAYSTNRMDYVIINEGKKIEQWINFIREDSPGAFHLLMDSSKGVPIKKMRSYWSFADFEGGSLLTVTLERPDKNTLALLRRFSNVFGLAYRRFADLKQAEAQTREAKIETALEKIRSRSLAMQRSDELKDVVDIVFEKLRELGLAFDGAGLQLFKQGSKDSVLWIRGVALAEPVLVNYPYDKDAIRKNTILDDIWKAKAAGGTILNKSYSFHEKNKMVEYVGKYNKSNGVPPEVVEKMLQAPGYTATFIMDKNSGLWADSWAGQTVTIEEFKILQRIAKVFEQAYTRFLDLQKAEAQAREAQIEAALEKIRSCSLGMQRSDELKDVVAILFEKLKDLNLVFDGGAAIHLFKENSKDAIIWVASPELQAPACNSLPYDKDAFTSNPIILDVWKAKERGVDILNKTYSFEEKNKYFEYVFKHNGETILPESVRHFIRNAHSYTATFISEKNSLLGASSWSEQLFSKDDIDILKRVAKVFEQAYTRFLDLQKAESQARESQIQLALERVRARTMAMQKSEELREVVAVIYEQLLHLGFVQQGSCNINIMDATTGNIDWWMTGFGNQKYPHRFHVEYIDHPTHKRQLSDWKSGIKYSTIEVGGESKREFDRLMLSQPDFEKMSEETKKMIASLDHVIFSFAFMKYGALSWAANPITGEQAKIFQRFATVFEQTYTRFLDLQKAEAQAREAQIEAALEKVRSRTLAMQKSEELPETSGIIFQQLRSLGIAPNRLYVCIIQNDEGNAEFWITDEDGSKVSMAYEDNLNHNFLFQKMYEGWKRKEKSMVLDIRGKELQDYLQYLSSIHVPFKSGPEQKRRWQYIAYFSKGFIGLASPDEQPAETLQLIERFAYVFNLTLTRFNDLKIAEAHALQAEQDLIQIKAARKKAEEALTELRAAQRQLIQSEKMASLGELTAGIAHEIQNPLNFVNNFSEVNKEMLEELKAERLKPNGERDESLQDELINDVFENSEKILHHGKRADGIIKGMLQHSRTSSGKKEPTDINALADEYLRLSFHGLRAKDKSFNAEMKTDFDHSIGKINIIPQDMGRVLLNLFNNAFYSVNEKKTSADENYKPEVSVQTKKLDDKIEIKVSDNGNGIPQNIIDKIFQPFFTTKPTGSGTGLGLSLSYDIITKEHTGTIKVESREGERSEFVIQLPL